MAANITQQPEADEESVRLASRDTTEQLAALEAASSTLADAERDRAEQIAARIRALAARTDALDPGEQQTVHRALALVLKDLPPAFAVRQRLPRSVPHEGLLARLGQVAAWLDHVEQRIQALDGQRVGRAADDLVGSLAAILADAPYLPPLPAAPAADGGYGDPDSPPEPDPCEVLEPLSALESAASCLSPAERDQVGQIVERVRCLLPRVDALDGSDQEAVYCALSLMLRELPPAFAVRQRASRSRLAHTSPTVRWPRLVPAGGSRSEGVTHEGLLGRLGQVTDWLDLLEAQIQDRDDQRVGQAVDDLAGDLSRLLAPTGLPALPPPRSLRRRSRRWWIVGPATTAAIILIALFGRDTHESRSTAQPSGFSTRAGDPRDTASPTPPDSPDPSGTEQAAAVSRAFRYATDNAAAAKAVVTGPPASPTVDCSQYPAPDVRYGEFRENYVADGYPVECLPPAGDWEGSLEPDGLAALVDFVGQHPNDPIYGQHPVAGADAHIVSIYGEAGAKIAARHLADANVGSDWVGRISRAVRALQEQR